MRPFHVGIQTSLWHALRPDGSPGANLVGEDGRPLTAEPDVGLVGSEDLAAWGKLSNQLGLALREDGQGVRDWRGDGLLMTVQLQDVVHPNGHLDLCAANALYFLRHVMERMLPEAKHCPFVDVNLYRDHQGLGPAMQGDPGVDAVARACVRGLLPIIQPMADHGQAFMLGGRPLVVVWAGWTPGQLAACEELRSRGWAVALDVAGGWPDEMVPSVWRGMSGVVDIATGFTLASPRTPARMAGVVGPWRYGCAVVARELRSNLVAFRHAGARIAHAVSPGYDDTAVHGERDALQILYGDLGEVEDIVELAAVDTDEVDDGKRLLFANSLDCRRERTEWEFTSGVGRSVRPLQPDGLPDRMGDPGRGHMRSLRRGLRRAAARLR